MSKDNVHDAPQGTSRYSGIQSVEIAGTGGQSSIKQYGSFAILHCLKSSRDLLMNTGAVWEKGKDRGMVFR